MFLILKQAEGELERIPRRLNPKVNPAIEDDVSSAASYDDFGQKSSSENSTSSSNTTISTTTNRTKANSTIKGDQVRRRLKCFGKNLMPLFKYSQSFISILA
jgi:hypothetical protein